MLFKGVGNVSRILTLVVEVDRPEADWIWENHKEGKAINGVKVNSISNGDLLEDLSKAEEEIADLHEHLKTIQ